MDRITFVSLITGELYTGFVLKRKRGRIKFGQTAGLTWIGRLQNVVTGYWYSEKNMEIIVEYLAAPPVVLAANDED